MVLVSTPRLAGLTRASWRAGSSALAPVPSSASPRPGHACQRSSPDAGCECPQPCGHKQCCQRRHCKQRWAACGLQRDKVQLRRDKSCAYGSEPSGRRSSSPGPAAVSSALCITARLSETTISPGCQLWTYLPHIERVHPTKSVMLVEESNKKCPETATISKSYERRNLPAVFDRHNLLNIAVQPQAIGQHQPTRHTKRRPWTYRRSCRFSSSVSAFFETSRCPAYVHRLASFL